MSTMNISLPDSLKKFVKERATQTDHSNPSDYIRTLIRQDKKNLVHDQLEKKLIDGLNSSDPHEMTPTDWKVIKQEVHKRLNHTQRV